MMVNHSLKHQASQNGNSLTLKTSYTNLQFCLESLLFCPSPLSTGWIQMILLGMGAVLITDYSLLVSPFPCQIYEHVYLQPGGVLNPLPRAEPGGSSALLFHRELQSSH